MLVIQIIIGLIITAFLQYKIVQKMGFKGFSLWFFTLSIFIPVLNLFAAIYLIVFPWPIHKEIKRLRENGLDVEMEKLRKQLGE